MYKLEEQDFYYRPTPKDADYSFDPVVWGDPQEQLIETLPEVFKIMSAFAEKWDAVSISSNDGMIYLTSGSDREKPDHPAYYYTPRHELRMYKREDI